MKTTITLFFLLCFFALDVKSQDNIVTLEIQAGGLEAAIPQEQWKKVQELTLKGTMNKADFYFMRDKLTGLITVDLKQVRTDTIPKEAFCNSACQKCILPLEVKYIGDNAFHKDLLKDFCEIIITGHFPLLGKDVLGNNSFDLCRFDVSNDNPYCKIENYNIYSKDNKTLYRYQFFGPSAGEIIEGTEIIEKKAFERAAFATLSFPATLKLIKENAFCNITPLKANSSCYDRELYVILHTELPPVLEKNAFNDNNFSQFTLFVPLNTVEIYKQADSQWNQFSEILDETTSVTNNADQSLSIEKTLNGIQIRSDRIITHIQIFSLTGILMNDIALDGKEIYIPVLSNKSYFIKITFQNGITQIIKSFI